MHADIAALTQSSQNAVSAMAALQTSDGALANAGLSLQGAVTLATEAASGGLRPITAAASTGNLSTGTTASIVAGHLVIATTTAGATLQASSNDLTLGALTLAATGGRSVTVFNSDGDSSSILSTVTAQPSWIGFGLQFSNWTLLRTRLQR